MITKEVYVSRVRAFLHEIARLNKKAARIGVAPIQYEDLGMETVSRTVVEKFDGEESVRTFPVDVRKFRVTLPEPANCPWETVAKITPTDEGAFVEPMPHGGAEFPLDAYKQADPQNCDHCHTRRARNISYVIRNKTDGKVMQLGRNCFGDYIGEDTLRAIEFQAVIVVNICDEDWACEYGGGAGRIASTVALRDCVGYAEYMFRTRGWQYNKKNEYTGELEVEGTHRFVKSMIQQIAEGHPSKTAAEIQARMTDEIWAAADAAIERMADFEATDEFGSTLKNLAEYQWVPTKKASLAAYIGQFLRQIDRKAQEAELNAKRVYVGTVGKREIFENLTCVRCHSFETQFGWSNINVFEDADHNVLVWKTGTHSFEQGDKVTLKGTVKEHSEYNGTKQTVLTRCKVQDKEAFAAANAAREQEVAQ